MKKGTAIMLVGLLLLGAGLGLMSYNTWDSSRAKEASDKVLAVIAPDIKEKAEEKSKLKEKMDQDIPGYDPVIADVDTEAEMPYVDVEGIKYIGILTIPAIDAEFPVSAECDMDDMRDTPCRYSGSVYKNDMIIAAHNYTTHFGRIGNLHFGDIIYFTDVDGNKYEYEVSEMETLRATAIYDMMNGNWDITLFTCDLSGQNRITVRATRTS